MWLFLILLAVPIIEIALFIAVDDVIGLWWTIGTVILTAIAGTLALRLQGAQMMNRARQAMHTPQDVPNVLGEGLLLFAAGLLLLTPGFLTDGIGALFLLPPTRRLIWRAIARNAAVHVAGASFSRGPAQSRPTESDPPEMDDTDASQTARHRGSQQSRFSERPEPADDRTDDIEDAVILDASPRSRPDE